MSLIDFLSGALAVIVSQIFYLIYRWVKSREKIRDFFNTLNELIHHYETFKRRLRAFEKKYRDKIKEIRTMYGSFCSIGVIVHGPIDEAIIKLDELAKTLYAVYMKLLELIDKKNQLKIKEKEKIAKTITPIKFNELERTLYSINPNTLPNDYKEIQLREVLRLTGRLPRNTMKPLIKANKAYKRKKEHHIPLKEIIKKHIKKNKKKQK